MVEKKSNRIHYTPYLRCLQMVMVILLGVEDAEVRLGEVQAAAAEGGNGRESLAARCWVSQNYKT